MLCGPAVENAVTEGLNVGVAVVVVVVLVVVLVVAVESLLEQPTNASIAMVNKGRRVVFMFCLWHEDNPP